ncbi:LacI family DNA-binding transcriptional regulator [Acidipropionibacterium virtanenii]|uniref:Lactose operon repressor n=1 Tax=Acidipropionibacterium virtanenii TaxID=2057246 RepID=A0A344UTE6_9ACTN|nr:LacI family DNA-binding transcriptional regulator [Acidipropionibacterium virtanenii]AXE38544.1 Lactose operon repressor [Acidipropionibacterium virtanenii]
MSESSRPPGMMDVARLAGVSHQTVSRVLNDAESVRPATREKVRRAITELGYRRNLSARALVTNRTRVIGVVVAQGGYYGPGSTSSAIQTAARGRGYATIVASLRDGSPGELAAVVDMLIDHGVEGITAIAPQLGFVEGLRSLARTVPIVVIADGFEVSRGMYAVSVDQRHGARLATQHLIGLGHRRIVHISGSSDWFDARERVAGWRAALEDTGLEVPEVLLGDWSAESGYAMGGRLVDQGLPDAVFCSNDLMALGLLSSLADLGIRVPEDISLVGFDDIDGSAYFQPPLTTVRQPFEELGKSCVGVLLRAIEGQEAASQRIRPSLLVRRSSRRRQD